MKAKHYAIAGPAYPFRGGIAQYTASLYLALRRDHKVTLFSFRRQYPSLLFPGKTQLDESQQPLQVPCHPVLDPLAPWTWMRSARAILAASPDVLLVMWWHPFFALMLAYLARRARHTRRIHVVFLCHNVMPHESNWVDRWLLGLAYRYPTHFLVQSSEERQRLARFRRNVPVEVVFHPAQAFMGDPQRLDRESARRQLTDLGVLPPSPETPTQDHRRILLYFGYIRPYKGVDILLRALPRVLQRLGVELILAGESYESGEGYRRLIRDLGLSSAVHVVDRYIPNEQVSCFFIAADAVILPYRHGTQSGVAPLALHFERPVIVTRVGGIPEVIEDGKSGLIVEPEDPEALARSIVRFYEEGLGERLRPHLRPAAERLSWAALVERIDRFLTGAARRESEENER